MSKFYVVWNGRKPGIYTTWTDCQKQVQGFKGAVFKSFASKSEAVEAFGVQVNESQPGSTKSASGPIYPSISVDAACSGNPGVMEYRGVWTETGEVLFHQGPFKRGTNNIGEFLAIVHALAMCDKNGWDMPIYSDSVNAQLWLRGKKCNTTLERDALTQELFEVIDRAEKWLKENKVKNPILKWDTPKWGEVKADFGRK